MALATFHSQTMNIHFSDKALARIRDLGLRMNVIGTQHILKQCVELAETLHDFKDDGGKVILRDKDGKEEEV